MAIDKLIKTTLPNTSKIMYRRTEVLKECGWTETEAADLIIFNNIIFPNITQEANIVWSEIMANIITHIEGITKNPMEWTVKYKFWLNSKFICILLGLAMFQENLETNDKGKINFQLKNLYKL